MKTALEWKKYYSSPEFREHYIYDNDDLGVSCTDSGTSFKLWSPSADSVTLNLYHEGDGGAAYAHIPMKKEDQGVWSSFFDENLHGVYYDYSLMFGEENVRSADPYAYACGVNGRRSRSFMNFMSRNFPGIRPVVFRNSTGENIRNLHARTRRFMETASTRRE